MQKSSINSILKPLSPDYVGAYLNPNFQLYHYLEWILNQVGKSDVTIITFSLSEEFIRKIWMLKEMDLVGEVTVILDQKAQLKIQHLISFAENVFSEIHYCQTHAKILIVNSQMYNVAIVGSQNCTRGNREESGIITTNVETCAKLTSEIERILCNTINQYLTK